MVVQKKKNKKGAGRPVKVFDWEKIKQYCFIQCTHSEICYLLDCDQDTLHTACKREHGKNFSEYYNVHAAGGKASLRREMFKSAMAGSVPMMIWMSKNYLNMKENWNLPDDISPIQIGYDPKISEAKDNNKIITIDGDT